MFDSTRFGTGIEKAGDLGGAPCAVRMLCGNYTLFDEQLALVAAVVFSLYFGSYTNPT